MTSGDYRPVAGHPRDLGDHRGLTKMDLMNDIMHDRHGCKAINKWAGE